MKNSTRAAGQLRSCFHFFGLGFSMISLLASVVLGGFLSTGTDSMERLHESHVRLLATADSTMKVDGLLAQAVNSTQVRILELEQKISDINDRTRSMKTDFPTGAVVVSYFGYGLVGFILLGPLVLLFSSLSSSLAFLIVPGIIMTILGVAGVACLIGGLVWGFSSSSAAKAERSNLVREREGYERELKMLKSGIPAASSTSVRREEWLNTDPEMVTLATF